MNLSSCKHLIRTLFLEGIASVKPDKLINSVLRINKDRVMVDGNSFDVSNGKCYIIGFGKAVVDMAFQAERILSNKLYKGVLSVPHGLKINDNFNSKIKIYYGAMNNIPDVKSLEATDEIINIAKEANENDLVLVLISGGGSALLSKPKDSLTLNDKKCLIKALSNSGADIKELNCVRKRISEVKGGKLSRYIYPATSVSLILSDVVGDPVDLIASGPTVQNTESNSKAIAILEKYNLNNDSYKNIITTIENDSDVDSDIFDNGYNIILANNSLALATIKKEAVNCGYPSVILSSCIEENVETLSRIYARLSQTIIEFKKNGDTTVITSLLKELNIADEEVDEVKKILDCKPERLCLLLGGETMVNVRGTGKGGRNQELVLRFSKDLDAMYRGNLDETNLLFLSAGTDGIDGPTDAAGALTYCGQSIRAIKQGLLPNDYLLNSDSYNYFNRLNHSEDLIKIGHTGVNVMDLHIFLIHF